MVNWLQGRPGCMCSRKSHGPHLRSFEITKCELTLVNKSGFSVVMTLWGKQAEDYNVEENVIIAFKSVKVGNFDGHLLWTYSSSMMSINSEINEWSALRGWYDTIGAKLSFQSHMNNFAGAGSSGVFEHSWLWDLNEVKTSQVGLSNKGPENFSTRVTIMHIKQDNILYPACQMVGCNKKVKEINNSWRCKKCHHSFKFPKPEFWYLLLMTVGSCGLVWAGLVTGIQWCWYSCVWEGCDLPGCNIGLTLFLFLTGMWRIRV